MNRYDTIVIGSGLSGLYTALLLAKRGKKVAIVEKNNQYGGNLQTFSRNKVLFDTGVHYLGSLAEGEVLYNYFKEVGIMEDLTLERLNTDAYDRICFGDTPAIEYPHAQGYENFIRQLLVYFPEEETALRRYAEEMQAVCDRFPLYRNRRETERYDIDLLSRKLLSFLDEITTNKRLKAVLLGSNFLYAGVSEQTPLYVHALSVNSYIQSAWRLKKGGSQITNLLIKQLRKLGVELFKNTEITGFQLDTQHSITGAISADNAVFEADSFVSAIDIKALLQLTGKTPFRPSFYNRVMRLQPVASVFSLHLVLKPKSFPYLPYNVYWFSDEASVYRTYPEAGAAPHTYMLSMSPPREEDGYSDNATILTYMSPEEVAPWADTFNTKNAPNDRTEEYEAFKAAKAEALLAVVCEKYPTLREAIAYSYTSTPLTYRDYIGNPTGAIYGYQKNADRIMESVIMPQTHIKNLYLTGQSIGMHGLVGVTIKAVVCAEVIP